MHVLLPCFLTGSVIKHDRHVGNYYLVRSHRRWPASADRFWSKHSCVDPTPSTSNNCRLVVAGGYAAIWRCTTLYLLIGERPLGRRRARCALVLQAPAEHWLTDLAGRRVPLMTLADGYVANAERLNAEQWAQRSGFRRLTENLFQLVNPLL